MTVLVLALTAGFGVLTYEVWQLRGRVAKLEHAAWTQERFRAVGMAS